MNYKGDSYGRCSVQKNRKFDPLAIKKSKKSTFLRKNRQNSVELTCLCVQNIVSYIHNNTVDDTIKRRGYTMSKQKLEITPTTKPEELFNVLFETPLAEDTEEWKRLQRIDLDKLTTYELECLKDEVGSLLQQRKQEQTNDC